VRSEILRKAYDLIVRDRDDLAHLISAENGKSLADATGEVTYAAEFFRWFAEEAVRPGGEFGEAPAGGARTLVTHRPVGIAALVTPWNFPAAMATRKIAPALAAGCTVVLKPAAETPLTALAIERLLSEAGVPDGVVNLVTTTHAPDVVGTWLRDPRVRKVSFTGSTGVGKVLLRQAAERVVNASMELGGNAPFVVTEDADIGAAVAGAMVAKFRNGGQACTAANRFYVHVDVADEFVERFGGETERLTVGPAIDGCAIGPLISAAAVRRVESAVASAVAQGARISHRATLTDSSGHFFAPTLLTDVPPGADILPRRTSCWNWQTARNTASPRTSLPVISDGPSGSASPWRSAWSVSTADSCLTPQPRSAESGRAASGVRAPERDSVSSRKLGT
jgi:succinate-semialdehyde dehydrogenase/glutarate-semialdehyde dehydrogenase